MISKLTLIFILFFGNVWTIEYIEEPASRLVLICGASCAGKSTLSKALAKNLGNNWIVLDRDEWAENEDSDEKVDQLLIENILKNLKEGLNVVVDTQSFQPLPRSLAELDPYTIFLYTSLPQLIERDQMRNLNRPRSTQRQRYARGFVLDTYAQLLTFKPSGSESVLDCLDASSIDPDFAIYPIHEETYHFFLQIIQAKEPLCIYPAAVYRMIIRGDRQTLDESIKEISESIKKVKVWSNQYL